MKSQSRLSLKAITLAACLIFMAAAAEQAAAQRIGWGQLPGLVSSASPALSGHSDGKLYIAAVNKQGAMFYRSTDSPTGWTTWQPINSGAPVFAADTAPVFARDGNTLYLFARGADSNIYVTTSKTGSGGWSYWQPLATGGQVAGRFSIGFTRLNASGNLEIHVVFKAYADTVKYMLFDNNWMPTELTRQWTGAQEGTIGSNGYEAVVAIRTANAVVVDSVRRLLGFPDFTWIFLAVTTRTAEGAEGHLYELSNIVYLGEAFHVTYTIKYFNSTSTLGAYAHAIEHARFRLGKTYDGYRRQVATWDPNGSPPQSELCVYRNKLVAAYRDHQGYVRYARWDNADPGGPWVGREVVANGSTRRRPVLAAYNRFLSNVSPDLSASNFGNDLFAAVNGYSDDALWVANFSRDIFRQELDRQFAIYNSNSDDLDPPCRNRSKPPAPTRISFFSDNRPVLSELGYNLWTLPNWFSGTLYKRAAERTCESGTLGYTGWYDPPCARAKSPIIIRRAGGIFVCFSIWINQGNDYKNIFEELGHTSASALGFHDDNTVPTSSEADLTGIPLSALQNGYTLFGEREGSCQDGTPRRCIGFTGFSYNWDTRTWKNYDVGSRQYSFIYAVYYYFSDGDQLRQWVQEDLSHGDNLLKRKYDWIRQYIFRGVEFKTDNEPLVSRPPCSYSLSSTSQHFVSGGGTSSVALLTQEGCAWTAKSNANWISITTSLSGSGSAGIIFSVGRNDTSANRTGTMTIAGRTVSVTQSAPSPVPCPKCPPRLP